MPSEPRLPLRHVRFRGAAAAAAPAAVAPGAPRRPGGQAAGLVVPGGRPLSPFPAWVLASGGLDPASFRPPCIERRVPACLRALRAKSAGDARRLLEKDQRLLRVAVSALVIGVTGFFRDQDVFDAMRRDVLPLLLARRGRLRVWSAGCSTGSELCTLAALLADAGGLSGAVLLGTDCRPDAIDEARMTTYDAASLAAMPSTLRNGSFVARHGRWEAKADLRAAMCWRVSDLCRTVEPGPWDIILWRNVAIYLTPAAARGIFDRLAGVLRPGGVLVVGKAERPPAGLPLRWESRCIYRRTGGQDDLELE